MSKGTADSSGPKSQGKQEVQPGGDYNAHDAYQKTDSPASAKQGVGEKTKYKHR